MNTASTIPRPPVIAVMGHIDHGKSSLLDYIRKTKVVESEAGGITQHLSAYEVVHETAEGRTQRITFLDTPGHEAFQAMRSRGSAAADIAVLVVSAEDGVKPQTLEALRAIKESGIPFVVAITKIDKESANVERAKMSLLENEIYLEGLGGDVPYVPVSSKTGQGIPELLDMLILVADLSELVAHPEAPAEGIVIESHRDPKKGIAATLIVKEGTLRAGSFVVAGSTWAPLRIMEDFAGKSMKEVLVSQPVTISGFSDLPDVGTRFSVENDKRNAEAKANDNALEMKSGESATQDRDAKLILVAVVKGDAGGSVEATLHELRKRESDDVQIKVLFSGVGAVTENDVKALGGDTEAVIVGFNVKIDAAAIELARRLGITIETFSIIYKLGEWVDELIAKRLSAVKAHEPLGEAEIVKVFSESKDGFLVGGRVRMGRIKRGHRVRVMRGESEIATGILASLQQFKSSVDEIAEGGEFGAMVRSGAPLGEGDVLVCLPPEN